MGVCLEGLLLLRLDQVGGAAPGNKRYKLQPNFEDARRRGLSRLLSFGGPWSNHLHALAGVARDEGFAATGIVRGETSTAMLDEVQGWGMDVVQVSRSDYRRRNDADYHEQLQRDFGPCLIIPEGGANVAGARGCLDIAQVIQASGLQPGRVVVAAGTGTTLGGIAAGLESSWQVTGVAALKGATDLEFRVRQAIEACEPLHRAAWEIDHDYHCGGFARLDDELMSFMAAFEASHSILLDPVYTAKAMFAVFCKLRSGEWSFDQPLVLVHTGGLQGRRGFNLGGYE
jgi:1-aminocyclopropane-1-carboxylate deaminase